MRAKPNIIFIMADDMGYGDLSCYGAEKISTPNMDSIADKGIRFTDAHSSSAVCTPSRYSVMTGRYCWRTWLKRGVIGGFGDPLIEPGRETIATLLKKAGYTTFAVGKWHLGLNWKKRNGEPLLEAGEHEILGSDKRLDGFNVDYAQGFSGGPCALGFDRFWGISGSLDMPPYCFLEDDHCVGIPDQEKHPYEAQQRRGLMTAGWQDDQCDVTFTRKAKEYINNHIVNNSSNPFFLYMTPAAPHRPCVPPDFIKGKSRAGRRGDAVCLVDWLVGEILGVLRKQNIEENTLIIVTSDNGARATCFNGKDYGHKSNGQWRGQKADIWEGGHREPFVAQWPAIIKPNIECNKTICLSDMFATFADITGVKIPEGTAEDSFNILPYLENPDTPEIIRDSVIHHSVDGMFSIRQDNWKLIDGLGSGGFTDPQRQEVHKGGPAGQLYDLSADPTETTNLYLEKPEIVARMRKILEKEST